MASGQVQVINAAGGTPRPLLPAAWISSARAVFAVWAPDGQTIFVKATDSTGRASFWASPAAGGAPRLLARFTNPSFASARQEFATDGKRLYFTADDRESDLKVMEVRKAP